MKNLKSFQQLNEHAPDQYSFFGNLEKMKRQIEDLLAMDREDINQTLSGNDDNDNNHPWAIDHIATAADDLEEVYNFLIGIDKN